MDIPRLQPGQAEDRAAALVKALKPERGSVATLLDVVATLGRQPALMKRGIVFGNNVLARTTLHAREREIVILRIGWLCQAEYEWAQHVEIGLRSGIEESEIEGIAAGPDASGWSERERALLTAVDELHADSFISDTTWQALSNHYDTEQLLDLIFTVGQYNMVSMALNSLGVQPEPGARRFPADPAKS